MFFEPILCSKFPCSFIPLLLLSQHSQHKWKYLGSFPYLKGKLLPAIHVRIMKNSFRRQVCESKHEVLIWFCRRCCIIVISLCRLGDCFQMTAALRFSAYCQSADTRRKYLSGKRPAKTRQHLTHRTYVSQDSSGFQAGLYIKSVF